MARPKTSTVKILKTLLILQVHKIELNLDKTFNSFYDSFRKITSHTSIINYRNYPLAISFATQSTETVKAKILSTDNAAYKLQSILQSSGE